MRGISILVVNYFSAQYVSRLVNSIEKFLSGYRRQVLVADNSVQADERNAVGALASRDVSVLFQSENIGFVRANNLLLSLATQEILVLLNPDTVLLDDSLHWLIEQVANDESIGAAGPELLNIDGSEQTSYYRFPRMWSVAAEHLLPFRLDPYKYPGTTTQATYCDIVKGACIVMRRDVANKVGLFDEEYVMYSEEADLCKRLQKNGYRVLHDPRSRILHYGEQSSKTPRATEYSVYHYNRSRLIYFRKHHSTLQLLVVTIIICLSLVQRVLILGLVGKRRSAKAHFRALCRLLPDIPMLMTSKAM